MYMSFCSVLVKNADKIHPRFDNSANVSKTWFDTTHQKTAAGNMIKNTQDICEYKYYTKEQVRNNQGK